MKKIIVPLVLVMTVILFVAYGWAGDAGHPNPATFYCNEMGYQAKVVTGNDGGQHSLCVLPGGKTCDIWAFFEGSCGAEYSYCTKKGYGLKVKTDGKDPFSGNYAVCVDRQSDKEIGPVGDLTGLKHRFRRSDKFDGEFFPIKKTHPKGHSLIAGAQLLAGAPPASFDWRSYNGSDWMTSVKDQCSCGLCWAFSAVGVSEVAYNIKKNNPNLDINLSEEYLNSDCEVADGGSDAGSCCGGSHDPAFDFIRDYGIPDEACLPFDVSYYSQGYVAGNCDCFGNPPCNPLCLGMPTNCSEHLCGARCADYAARKVKIDDYYSVGANQADIKQALVDQGPISVCLAMSGVWTGAGNDIFSCSASTCWDRDNDGVCDTAATAVCTAGKCSGVGRNCSTNADCVEDGGDGCNQDDCGINHCVIITGYDDAKGVWHVKNSWGSTWGAYPGGDPRNIGYFDVGYGECHIEAYPRYAVAGDMNFPLLSIPGNVMFDDTCVGSTSSETLNVCNTGTANLQVSAINSSDPQFVVTSPISGYPVIISPDFCYPFQVLFAPTSTGAKTSTLTILSNDIGHPSVTIQASGNGEQSAIQVSPNPLSFGNVPVDPTGGETDYKDLPLKVRNTGSCNLSVTAIASTGGNAGDFTLLTPNSALPTTVSPGAEFEFTIRFNPSASGSRTTTIRVTSNSGGVAGTTTDITANGSGVLPVIQVSPNPLAFGNVPVDPVGGETDYKDLPLKVRNTGNSNLSVTAIASTGGNAGDFTLLTPNSALPTTVSPGAEFEFTIRFNPSASGSRTTTIRVTSNSGGIAGTTTDITANGSGVLPVIQVSPNPLAFGNVPVNPVGGELGYKDLSIKVRNTGNSNLQVTGIASSGGDSADFTLLDPAPGLPTIISANAEFDFKLRFDPSSTGTRSTTIVVTSNSGGVPGTTTGITANGVGVMPDIKVSGSTDFGDVCAETMAEKTVSICNNGNSNLNVTSVGFNPPCSDFTLINSPFPTSVSPDSCMGVVVRFTPTSDGPKSCSLVILSNDPDQPEITLTVTGNTPEPSIDIPADLGFAPTVIQSIGVCQSQKPFPVSNTGKCNLNITNLTITNNEAEYSLLGTPSLPIILDPGHIAGDGDLMAVFGPLTINRDLSGQLTVTYESDAITHDTTTVTRQLCGEGVMTGARVLVTQSGTPVDFVESIKIQRITGNRNRKIIDTVDMSKNLYLQTVTPDSPCGGFQYHKEYGTVSNQIQLLPGSYQVTATAMINGKRKSKTVGFDVDTCGFNQNITVKF